MVTIRRLRAGDFEDGSFFETLGSLTEVNLTVAEAKVVYNRSLCGLGLSAVRVALEDGKVVGTATLIVEKKFIHRGGKVGHIEDVAVHPSHRGKDIGTKLIDHLIEEAKKYGCYKVILDCTDEVAPFYEKQGFRRYNVGMRIDL